MLGRIKLGRFAQSSDKVGAVIFLASPASEFLTGHTLFVDGGLSTSTCYNGLRRTALAPSPSLAVP